MVARLLAVSYPCMSLHVLLMWNRGEIRVCGGDFGEIGEDQEFGEKI